MVAAGEKDVTQGELHGKNRGLFLRTQTYSGTLINPPYFEIDQHLLRRFGRVLLCGVDVVVGFDDCQLYFSSPALDKSCRTSSVLPSFCEMARAAPTASPFNSGTCAALTASLSISRFG